MALARGDSITPQSQTARSSIDRADRTLLVAILLVALVLRLVVMLRMGTIDTEGAEYARIAENIRAGNGYCGIETPGKNLIFPPLFPLLIAAGSLVVGSAELGGRLVSVFMGTLLCVPVYFITRDLYGRRAAPIAATLVAVHPMLIGFAASVYCESTYMALLMSAVWLSLRILRSPTTRSLLLTGATFGAAYLVRPEAAMYAVLVATLVTVLQVTRGLTVSFAARQGLSLLAAFALLALPYVWWLHAQSGQWRMEGKSALNYATELMMERGSDSYEASFRIEPDLTERGVWMKSHAAALQQVKMPLAELVPYAVHRLKLVAPFLKNTLTAGGMLGAPWLFILSLLGFFSKPWTRQLAVAQLLFLSILGGAGSALLFIFYLSPRFLITFIPFLSIWAASGALVVFDWLTATVGVLFHGRYARALVWTGRALTVLAVPLGTLQGVANLYELQMFDHDKRPIKLAGEWLDHYAPGAKVVTDSLDVLPFHAHATFVPLPYAESGTALRYLRHKHVRFVVLHDTDTTSTPYLKSWVANGLPVADARLIYNRSSPTLGRILIYEWM